MSIMRPKLEKDEKRIQSEIKRAKEENCNLDKKFRIISSLLRAQPLGLCGLAPEKEYPVIEIERINRKIVHYFSELYSNRTVPYPLPERYGEMVSEADIEKINSGKIKFNLVRTVKKFGPDRYWFDHKNYTWDLELVRCPLLREEDVKFTSIKK